MTKHPTGLETAMKGRKLRTRGKAEIQADMGEAIAWAETEGRSLPIQVKRGRPSAKEAPRDTRSVTVRFPAALAKVVEAAADRQGLSISEFVRGAALAASGPRKPAPRARRVPAGPPMVTRGR